MPKTLTDVDQFDASIVVPLGADSRNDAAGDVERIAQRLANRTHYLNQRSGKLAGGNTWTGSNTFQAPTYLQDLLEIDPNNSESPAIHIDWSGGDYQDLLTARASSNTLDRIHIYSGSNGSTQGAIYLVVNARWTPAGWVRNVAGRSSTALIIRDGDVRVVSKDPGEAEPWVSWQQNTISAFGSELLSEAVRAARMLTTANIFSDYSNGFRYSSPVQRVSPIPLGLAWGNVYYNSDGHLCRRALGPGEVDAVWFPVPVPPFCEIVQVHVNFYQSQNDVPDRFQLYRRQQAGAWSAVGSYATHPVGAPQPTTNFTVPGSPLVVLDGDEYAYKWTLHSGDPAVGNNRIVGLGVTWNDIGPSNRVG